jgi:hypothetical protein
MNARSQLDPLRRAHARRKHNRSSLGRFRLDSVPKNPSSSSAQHPLFSISSALFQNITQLTENNRQNPFCNSLIFNHLRTLFHFSAGSPLFPVCSPKHTGGVPPAGSRPPRPLSRKIANLPAIIIFHAFRYRPSAHSRIQAVYSSSPATIGSATISGTS